MLTQTRFGNEFNDTKQAKKVEHVSKRDSGKVPLFKQVFHGKASPLQAITAQCLDCCDLDEAAIQECKATACPLWKLRPYQAKGVQK